MELHKELNTKGYLWFKQLIPTDDLITAGKVSLSLKENLINNGLLGTPKNTGGPIYHRTIDMSGTLSEELYKMYTSGWMVDLAKKILNQDYIYAFNDQVVVKLANEDFLFPEHTDNFFGPDPEEAKRGAFRTITCCWVLTDFTELNGPISILDKENNSWITPLAKSGDMLVWDGNTPHKSSLNLSSDARCVWLQIYATHDIANRPNVNTNSLVSKVDFTRFYSIRL